MERPEIRKQFEETMCDPRKQNVTFCKFYKGKIDAPGEPVDGQRCPETCWYAELKNEKLNCSYDISP